jgi:hypothetical protein
MPKITHPIFLHGQGRAFRITGIFTGDYDANAFCETNPGESVIACNTGLVFTARHDDKGTPVNDDKLIAALRRIADYDADDGDELARIARAALAKVPS